MVRGELRATPSVTQAVSLIEDQSWSSLDQNACGCKTCMLLSAPAGPVLLNNLDVQACRWTKFIFEMGLHVSGRRLLLDHFETPVRACNRELALDWAHRKAHV